MYYYFHSGPIDFSHPPTYRTRTPVDRQNNAQIPPRTGRDSTYIALPLSHFSYFSIVRFVVVGPYAHFEIRHIFLASQIKHLHAIYYLLVQSRPISFILGTIPDPPTKPPRFLDNVYRSGSLHVDQLQYHISFTFRL